MPSNLESLTQINLDDLAASFGWQDRPLLSKLLRTLFRKPAKAFAEYMVEFDNAIGEHGLVEASRLTQGHFVRDVRVFGRDPSTGFRQAQPDSSGQRRLPDSAFLALSNHPGISDTLSAFCALNRTDLKIIALDRPFLNALPNMSRQLLYLEDDPASRIRLVRQVSSQLRNGGAVLTFPAGHIEPDPDVYEGAVDSLQAWTDSAGVFIRLAPETAIIPILVRGVVWEKAARHILLKIKRSKEEKEKLAAALQLLAHVAFKKKDVLVRVQIGNPIYAKELGTTETAVLHRAVIAEMKQLIENPPAGEGVSVMK